MNATALAVLSIPLYLLASKLEWGNAAISSPWTRKALWLGFYAAIGGSLATQVMG